MMIAVYLIGIATVVATVATRTLPTAAWVYRAPRLGLAAWHTVLAVISLSVAGAVGSLFAHWPTTIDMVCDWWAWCIQALGGTMGAGTQILSWLILGGIATLAARAAHRAWTITTQALQRRREHHQLLTLAARPDHTLGALVVDYPHPAAYVLSGWSSQVVVTKGAIDQLPPEQLAAVLAHERAHAHGRHHLMLTTARVLTTAFPGVAAFAHAHRQIDRLIEICADDTATAKHRRIDLARALVTCAEAATRTLVPAGAPAAHGGDAVERIHRLLDPPQPLPPAARRLLALGMGAMLAVPLSIVALGQIFPALAACLPNITS